MVSLARDSCALPDFFFFNVEVRNLEVDIYRRHKKNMKQKKIAKSKKMKNSCESYVSDARYD